MKHTFNSYITDNYKLNVDYEWSDVPYTYENLNWLSDNKPTEEFITETINTLNEQEPYRQLRKLRDEKIAETDWVTLRAYSQGTPVPEEWATYQQALRDITSTQTPTLDENYNLDLDSFTWPVKPE